MVLNHKHNVLTLTSVYTRTRATKVCHLVVQTRLPSFEQINATANHSFRIPSDAELVLLIFFFFDIRSS